MFFLRITEWGWEDAPARVPIFFGDVPKRSEPLPRFLDDREYARFMRALAAEPHLHRRVATELLARTGMRVGELCQLEGTQIDHDVGPEAGQQLGGLVAGASPNRGRQEMRFTPPLDVATPSVFGRGSGSPANRD